MNEITLDTLTPDRGDRTAVLAAAVRAVLHRIDTRGATREDTLEYLQTLGLIESAATPTGQTVRNAARSARRRRARLQARESA